MGRNPHTDHWRALSAPPPPPPTPLTSSTLQTLNSTYSLEVEGRQKLARAQRLQETARELGFDLPKKQLLGEFYELSDWLTSRPLEGHFGSPIFKNYIAKDATHAYTTSDGRERVSNNDNNSDQPISEGIDVDKAKEILDIVFDKVTNDIIASLAFQLPTIVQAAQTTSGTQGRSGPPNHSQEDLQSQPINLGRPQDNRSRKRARGGGKEPDDSGDDSSDDSDRNNNEPKGNRRPHLGLRCPFFSHNPAKYANIHACSSGRGFADMPRLR